MNLTSFPRSVLKLFILGQQSLSQLDLGKDLQEEEKLLRKIFALYTSSPSLFSGYSHYQEQVLTVY